MTGNSFQDIPFELRALEVVLDTVRVRRGAVACAWRIRTTGVDDV